tara:strand:- start:195 stop:497 length:303 start_codon:yes stop_codon:yes gene_type:complete
MNLSEPDTLFFRDCAEYILSSNKRPFSLLSNVKNLADIDDNSELVGEYLKWMEMYISILRIKKLDGLNSKRQEKLIGRIRNIKISFQEALMERALGRANV